MEASLNMMVAQWCVSCAIMLFVSSLRAPIIPWYCFGIGVVLFSMGCQPNHSVSTAYVQLQLERVRDCMEKQQFALAVQELQQVQTHYPNNPQVLELLALAYVENKQIYLAAQTFEKTIHADITGDFQENALRAAHAYEQVGDFYSASRCYQHYLNHFPKDRLAWFALADSESKLERHPNALQAFLRGIDLLKIDLTVKHMVKLSQLCFAAEKIEEAIYWNLEALKIEPENVNIYLQTLRMAHGQKHSTLVRKLIEALDCLDKNALEREQLDFLRELYGLNPH
ncbi:MAG: tetratricopeptide repeat protein [Puniceicoccales bacterium]|jgi:tetratricopeptide (TPR) repeat protein|nr:tetratricopeptide repeat protein [Puniceicoccales bacterium]